MNKYLITYLIADFDGSGRDCQRTGMAVAESTKPLAAVGYALAGGFHHHEKFGNYIHEYS